MGYFADLHLRLSEAGIDPDAERWCPRCGQRLKCIALHGRTAEFYCSNVACQHHTEHLFFSDLSSPGSRRSEGDDDGQAI